MKAGFAIILTLALGALAANYLLADNGYVLINFRGYLIEMSVPVLIFLLIVTYMAVRLVVRVWRAPRQLGEATARRRRRKANERMTQGFIELGQGNYSRGEKLLTSGVRNSEAPLLNYLAAARAAQAQGDTVRRDNWLNMASEQEPRARATVLLTRAELQLADDDDEAARASLDEVLQISPRHPEALRMKAELCFSAEDWSSLEALLPAVRKYAKVETATIDEWTVQTWSALFAEATNDGVRRKTLWKTLPKPLRTDSRVIAARVRAMLAAGDSAAAEPMLRGALKKQWDKELVLLYGELPEPAPAALLKRVEKWLRNRPEDAALLLVAARLCVTSELWGKARSYFEASVAIDPAPRTWHELGQLMLQMGEQEAAFEAFQKGLTQSYDGDDELPRLTDASLEEE